MPLRRVRTTLANTCSCVVFENSLQKSRGCVRPREAFAINPIRGRERGPSRDSRVCPKQHGIVAVKGRSARPTGGKTSGAERARRGTDHAPPLRGSRRKTEAVEMHLSMEVVSDQERVRSSRTPPVTDLGAASVCEPMRRDPQAGTPTRRDGHDIGSVDGERGGTTSHHARARSKRQRVDPPEPPRRRETAGCSIVRPTGGNSFRAGGKGGTGKIPLERGATSSRTNEARVLRLKQQMAETGCTHLASRSRSRRKTRSATER